ncbi:hypothetical protein [Derxia lacustris]|uniref:hypothetical protein n=1 Tax=Derxia lacustris TaxID=764842 RepID=UPI00111C4AB2|nr:hypothetical protein [Derxia lacustris]
MDRRHRETAPDVEALGNPVNTAWIEQRIPKGRKKNCIARRFSRFQPEDFRQGESRAVARGSAVIETNSPNSIADKDRRAAILATTHQLLLAKRSAVNKRILTVLARCLVGLTASAALTGCIGGMLERREARIRSETAYAMWQERCKKSGEFIYRTVDEVEGVYLLKVRPEELNFGNQFELSDPYGKDMGGDGYIKSFLRNSYRRGKEAPESKESFPRLGYHYVEAEEQNNGKLYRYTGRIDEPWKTNSAALEGYTRFALTATPASNRTARYGLTYEDISTREEREYWIAGSLLRIIDLQTNEVIAERIGYMVDLGQGNRAGGRSPWLFAADHACPDFHRTPNPKYRVPGSSAQSWQTLDFVEKALRPAK